MRAYNTTYRSINIFASSGFVFTPISAFNLFHRSFSGPMYITERAFLLDLTSFALFLAESLALGLPTDSRGSLMGVAIFHLQFYPGSSCACANSRKYSLGFREICRCCCCRIKCKLTLYYILIIQTSKSLFYLYSSTQGRTISFIRTTLELNSGVSFSLLII